jgi:hypothetical protein
MPRQRKPREPQVPPDHTRSQEDESDILEEVGAERDEENGGFLVDDETIRGLGAVDATSVRENRRLSAVVDKKRKKIKDVPFGTNDPLIIYETILRYCAADAIDISVTRLTGSSVRHMIISRPLSGAVLYEAIKVIHGQSGETEYEVKFTDAGRGTYQGTGRITMPDTRPATQQGQRPVYQHQNGAPPPVVQVVPQATDPMAMFKMFQQMQAALQPQVQPPSSPQVSSTDPTAAMWEAFKVFQQMQGTQQPTVPASPSAPQSEFDRMREMFGFFQQMQGTASASPPLASSQPVAPPVAQPSELEKMREMMLFIREMQASVTPTTPRQGPYSGPRSPYYDPQGGAPPYARPPGAPPQPPPRPPTPAEQWREAITFMRTANDAVQEMRSLLPDQGQQETFSTEEDEDNPIRIMETGPGKIKLAFGKTDGAMRWTETGMMALPELLKWVGEQHEMIQQSARKRQQPPPPPQQLPPGYVEVTPGYQPPPGYRAVAVEQQDFPPPPEYVPPPIQEPPPPVRQAWGAPTIPSEDPEQ